ncbi:MAG: universal stress protein [Candidatus Promineifilaceae bacterium]|nr:universal stress protein [Candidatus Promineifilaceae bacterium]
MAEQEVQAEHEVGAEQELREETMELAIQQILVALDNSTHSLAALHAAARLAATVHAKLLGLFVEDINLLRLASLPFAREVRWPTAREEKLDREQMEHDLRLRASQARRALAYAADQVEAEWSFRVVRGVVSKEVLEAALEADLLSLGRASRSERSHVPLGSTARAAAVQAPRPVLVARVGADLQQPIAVTYDGSPTGSRALAAAVQMARANESNLLILIVARDAETITRLAARAQRLVQPHVSHTEIRAFRHDDEYVLAQTLQQETCGAVILGGESQILQGAALQTLLDELDCPVMVVR